MSNSGRPLTNLEHVALAHLWRTGSMTAHELRLAFAESSAGRYSGSAGAIYPLVKRLSARGLVKGKPDHNGAQKKVLFEITKAGRNAVQEWMFDMKPPAIFPDDPLRTRFQYAYLLSNKQRRDWFSAARNAIDLLEASIKSEYALDEYQSVTDQHVARGAIGANAARRHWLEKGVKILRGI